jgi:hypothetical protein
MNQQTSKADINYEQLPAGMAMDETDINLRAHFARMSDDKISEYNPTWTDDQLLAWDEDFRDDGVLFLVCSERDVEIEEYRRVLVEHIRFRFAPK